MVKHGYISGSYWLASSTFIRFPQLMKDFKWCWGQERGFAAVVDPIFHVSTHYFWSLDQLFIERQEAMDGDSPTASGVCNFLRPTQWRHLHCVWYSGSRRQHPYRSWRQKLSTDSPQLCNLLLSITQVAFQRERCHSCFTNCSGINGMYHGSLQVLDFSTPFHLELKRWLLCPSSSSLHHNWGN